LKNFRPRRQEIHFFEPSQLYRFSFTISIGNVSIKAPLKINNTVFITGPSYAFGYNGGMKKLDAVVIETQPNPDMAVIWLHGLGADGNDFAPIGKRSRLYILA
jgi:hypothetical protein